MGRWSVQTLLRSGKVTENYESNEGDDKPPTYASAVAGHSHSDMVDGVEKERDPTDEKHTHKKMVTEVPASGEGASSVRCSNKLAARMTHNTVAAQMASDEAIDEVCETVMAEFKTVLRQDMQRFTTAYALYRPVLLSDRDDVTGCAAVYRQMASIASRGAEASRTNRSSNEFMHRIIAAFYNRYADDAVDKIETGIPAGVEGQNSCTLARDSRKVTSKHERFGPVPRVSKEQAKAIAEANRIRRLALKARDNALRAGGKAVVGSDPGGDSTYDHINAGLKLDSRQAAAGAVQLALAEQARDEAIIARDRAVMDDILSPEAVQKVLNKWDDVPEFEPALRAALKSVARQMSGLGHATHWRDHDVSGYGDAYHTVACAARREGSGRRKREVEKPSVLASRVVANVYFQLAADAESRERAGKSR